VWAKRKSILNVDFFVGRRTAKSGHELSNTPNPAAKGVSLRRPMSLTATQAGTITAIVNLFETSQVLGNYGQVTLLTGDTGHLTFGRSQTTLGSGTLHQLLQRYCNNTEAQFGPRLAQVLARTEAGDITLAQTASCTTSFAQPPTIRSCVMCRTSSLTRRISIRR
jgi:hypothetical protein